MSLWRRIYDERKRVVLPLVILLAVNAAAFVLVVVPLMGSVTAAEADRSDAKATLASAQLLSRQVKEARVSRERADQDLRRFYIEVLPADHATATRNTNLWLQRAADADGLVFKSSNASQRTERDSRLSRASATITLLGRYPNIRQFLHAVEAAEEFIIIERVELSEAEEQQPGAGAPLSVQLVVSSYYATEAPR